MTNKFKNITFNKQDKTFDISEGSIGKYSYTEIAKAEVVYEDDRYKGKTELFSHSIKVGGLQLFAWTSGNVWTGVRITLNNKEKIYVYISKKTSQWQSLQFYEDSRKARELCEYLQKIRDKYKEDKVTE